MKTVRVAKALLIDADGNMLMLRRSQTHPTMAGHRDLPGGIIEPGEEPGEALLREIDEEVGLKLSHDQLVPMYAGTNVYDDKSFVRTLYVIRLDEVQPKLNISWEHESAEWVPVSQLEEVETDFHTFYHDALHHLRVHTLL